MSRRSTTRRGLWLGIAAGVLAAMALGSLLAPEFLSRPDMALRHVGPMQRPPFGTDMMGISLAEYAMQGARVVTLPAVLSGMLVMVLATLAGLARCAGFGWLDGLLQAFSELVGAVPRLVLILVIAVAMPMDARSLLPIGLAWAILAAPGAMDEAATTAGRLGGASFVEALRAHGFTAPRIYLRHIVWLNLRSVIVRQGAEAAHPGQHDQPAEDRRYDVAAGGAAARVRRKAERGKLIGERDPVRRGAGGPTQPAGDERVESPRIAAGEQHREPGDRDHYGDGDRHEAQHDEVGDHHDRLPDH